jgi:class 3 adenylate cyclase
MHLIDDREQVKESFIGWENVQAELDRRIFHLKTLYDVSKDIFSTVDFQAILKNFLLMSMGNFGVMEGFILTLKIPSGEITHFESMGHQEGDLSALQEGARRLLLDTRSVGATESTASHVESRDRVPGVVCGVAFSIVPDSSGFLGLGPKLVGKSYNEDDKELLVTLVNNLVVGLRNARSFEDIRRLNLDLQEKNLQLENALNKLQAALRKVELLESVKANLSKFVPTTVCRLIEKTPTASIPEAKDQDVSVLFLDIEGYTKLSERLDGSELNKLIEKYFSVFMEAIYANNGDVNETAGDGLMVLYLSEDEKSNAMDAVRTALTIREKATFINHQDPSSSERLVVNMGINSGRALLGAASATADRVKGQFSLRSLGKFSLKNVSEEVEIFKLWSQVALLRT